MNDRTDTTEFLARDGFKLVGTLHRPTGAPRAVVVVASGTGVRRRFYDAFAKFLAEHELAALTFDYRGIGDSRPRKLAGFAATMHDWGALDLDAALAHALATFPGLPLAVVGHSAGGQLVGLAAHNSRVAALVGVAAQSGWYGHWPALGRLRMLANWFVVVPTVTRVVGYLPGQLGTGQHLPAGVAREWAAWCRSPDYLMMADRASREASFDRVRAPILALSFSDDGYAPRTAVEQLIGFYRAATPEFRHITPAEAGGPIGHFGFFREQQGRPLWPGVVTWLKGQVETAWPASAPPSG